MVCFGSGNLHGLRSLPTASSAEPCLDKWQLLPAWNGVLLLTVLNFLQNWPVRGSGSSFLAHLSGSDSFCSGVIKRVVKLLLPIAATRAKNSHFKRSPCVCVTFRQGCLSCEGQQLSRARPETSKTGIFLSEGQSTCPVNDQAVEPHWLFLLHISQAKLPLSHPALNLLCWHLQPLCRCAGLPLECLP